MGEAAASRHLRIQVARWRSVNGEVEKLLAGCIQADDKLVDLMQRCRAGDCLAGRSDLETSQEAIIRARMAKDGGQSYRETRVKTRSDRKKELLELRADLAKTSSELAAEGLCFQDGGAALSRGQSSSSLASQASQSSSRERRTPRTPGGKSPKSLKGGFSSASSSSRRSAGGPKTPSGSRGFGAKRLASATRASAGEMKTVEEGFERPLPKQLTGLNPTS